MNAVLNPFKLIREWEDKKYEIWMVEIFNDSDICLVELPCISYNNDNGKYPDTDFHGIDIGDFWGLLEYLLTFIYPYDNSLRRIIHRLYQSEGEIETPKGTTEKILDRAVVDKMIEKAMDEKYIQRNI